MKSIVSILFILLVFFCQPVSAAEKSEARLTLETALDSILVILNKPEFKDILKNGPLMREIKDKVYAVCDFQEFSARAVGAKWRGFTEEQQKNFMDAFGDLLFETYNSKLLAYEGQTINFINEIGNTSGDKAEIRTSIPLGDGKDIPVDYRMLRKPDGWKVYDMIIENISLVQNYRNQFQNVLNSQTPEQLIASLRTKATELKDKNEELQRK